MMRVAELMALLRVKSPDEEVIAHIVDAEAVVAELDADAGTVARVWPHVIERAQANELELVSTVAEWTAEAAEAHGLDLYLGEPNFNTD